MYTSRITTTLLCFVAFGAMGCAADSSPIDRGQVPASFSCVSIDRESVYVEDLDWSGGLSVGDWVVVGLMRFRVDAPGVWRLRTDSEVCRLYRTDAEGDERLVAVDLEGVDPSTLSDVEAEGLLGVTMPAWTTESTQLLERVNLEDACVTIWSGVPGSHAGRLGICDLVLERVDGETSDLGLPSLRRLVLNSAKPVNLATARSSRGLTYLKVLAPPGVEGLEHLSELPRLRTLDLSGCGGTVSLEALGGLTELRFVDLDRTKVRDLGRLLKAPSLQELRAQATYVTGLPECRTSLSTLRVVGSKISKEDLNRFRKLNPSCRVLADWNDPLEELRSADRLRVQKGAPNGAAACEVDVLVSSTDVASLLRAIRLVEDQNSFFLSEGGPTLEFYRGDSLVAELGVLPGIGGALRWQGAWPYDATLTPHSCQDLSEWLAERGVTGPLTELLNVGQYRDVLDAREVTIWRTFPSAVVEEEYLVDVEDLRAYFERTMSSELERAEQYLAAYGAHDGSWGLRVGFDDLVRTDLVGSIDDATLESLVSQPIDRSIEVGLARLVFGDGAWRRLSEEGRGRAVLSLARIGLSHPRASSRRLTLHALGSIGGAEAVAALRGFFDKGPASRRTPSGPEPLGWWVPFPDPGVPEGVSDRVYAAYLLLKLGDRSRFDSIRALIADGSSLEAEFLRATLSEMVDQ